MKPTYPRLPDAELEVMKALWALGDYPAHTGDIAQKLDKSWKAPTLLKLLSRLEERRFVAGTKEGRANAYTPLVKEADYLSSESRSFLEVFKSVGNTSVRYTELPGLGHDIFDTVYLDEAVSTWLFAQRRSH